MIHYVVFLMQHGRAPYRDIIDMNMPGMYLIDWLVIETFGGGSLAWRLFDFSLMALAAASMLTIAWPYSKFAGFFSAVLFTLVHGRDGIAQTGQRDLIMAVLLLVSTACLFLAARARRPPLVALAAIFAGTAVTIKPTGALFVVAFAMGTYAFFRGDKARLRRSILLGAAAFSMPLGVTTAFLYREHALIAFWSILHGLVPFHASLDQRHLSFLLLHSISPLLSLVIPWIFLVIRTRLWQSTEHRILLAAIACGVLSYCIQAKGYPYHRYPLLAFLLLSMGIVFTAALRDRGLNKFVGGAALLVGVLVIAPESDLLASEYDWHNQEFITMLESDLDHLGGADLSGQIQCMDTTAGCINTLYRMKLVQSTSSLYDCYFFAPGDAPITNQLRMRFWQELHANPPRVLIVSNQFCLGRPSAYNKVDNWPQFTRYLTQKYSLLEERTPPHMVRWWSVTQAPLGYRVYLRKITNLAPLPDPAPQESQ
ncbi:MAG TPA: glycosyltransferase family 39 protein [Silvibacterium sp.]|nr:glycosyltransferase family 39 protein [Silvibacterium sp.]